MEQQKSAFNWNKLFKFSRSVQPNQEMNKDIAVFDKLLDAQMLQVIFSMINDGYQPTKEQLNKYQSIVNTPFIEIHDLCTWQLEDKLKSIENLLTLGYKLNYNQAANIFFNVEFNIAFINNKVNYYPNISQQVRERLNSSELHIEFLNVWKSILDEASAYDLSSARYHVKNTHHILLSNINSLDDFLSLSKNYIHFVNTVFETYHSRPHDLTRDVKKEISQFDPIFLIQEFNSLSNHYFPDGIKQIIQNNKNSVNTHNLIINPISNLNNTNTSHLPSSTQSILLSLHHMYKEIQDNQSYLVPEEKFETHQLMSKRIPEIINQYFSINESYRDSLQSNGKNAIELTDNSLNNIRIYFLDIVESINKTKLNHLSVSERYTQSFNKNKP